MPSHGVVLTVELHPAIDFVRQHQHPVITRHAGDLIQRLGRICGTGRITRRVEDQQPWPRRVVAADLVQSFGSNTPTVFDIGG